MIRSVGLIKSYCRTETPHTHTRTHTHTHTHSGPHLPYLSAGKIISDARLPEYRRKVVCVRATKGTSKGLIKASVISSKVKV